MPTVVAAETDERDALLGFLAAQRGALRRAVGGLTAEQAAARPTVSELSVIGLVKHVAETESNWVRTILAGRPPLRPREQSSWGDSFRLEPGESVESVLAFYDRVEAETAEIVGALPGLDTSVPLPDAPWFPRDARRSARWIMMHLVEEVARHAGHADILRESIDGATAFALIPAEQLRPNG
ncbi:DinB family protein [Streptacidiphilus sp. PB12-B1b]|uniref:DinB family protein n=1 Tax=Streptacidiphilus sp. PB12-B1b TaxID=2705012 RepID=UPI0015FB28CD|nr:DinB family protein [Streptacidiphilus sp. PB12-B1b]QMU74912.1 DinB family protein [Streptacidiphilus sp. PB12-B1b]